MLGFGSSEEEESGSESVSKRILTADDKEMYEKQYQEVRKNLQSLNTNIKMQTTIDGYNIPSASHDYSDLEDLISELKRVESDLRSHDPLVMVKSELWMCKYCIHMIRSLQDLIDIEQEVQDD